MALETALVLLGVVALALVFVVSWLRDRGGRLAGKGIRIGPMSRGLIRSRDFILGRHEGISSDEPTLGRLDDGIDIEPSQLPIFDDGLPAEDEPESVPVRRGSSIASGSDAAVAPSRSAADVEAAPAGDEGSVKQLDFWVRIVGEEPVERDRILAIYREHEYLLDHAHTIHGRIVPGGQWCDVEKQPETASFTDVVITLQLCDRNGPVTESEMTRFNSLVFALSESLDRKFKLQGTVEEALAQAERLDRFCQENDVFAIINICGEGGRRFKGQEVLRAVEGSGMRYGELKVFHGPEGASGEPVYSLANMVKPGTFELDKIRDFTTPGLTMFMSVPRCVNPADVFSRMAYVARKIANQLGGIMLDQKEQALDDAAIKQIRRQVEEMGGAMTRRGISPGSEEALRLF